MLLVWMQCYEDRRGSGVVGSLLLVGVLVVPNSPQWCVPVKIAKDGSGCSSSCIVYCWSRSTRREIVKEGV